MVLDHGRGSSPNRGRLVTNGVEGTEELLATFSTHLVSNSGARIHRGVVLKLENNAGNDEWLLRELNPLTSKENFNILQLSSCSSIRFRGNSTKIWKPK